MQADPQNDTCNPLRYVPNKPINIVAAVLYFLVAIALTYSAFTLSYEVELTDIDQIRYKANYMLVLTIGAYCEGLGFVFRLILRNNLHSTGIYIVQYLFVVLSVSTSLRSIQK
jgi:hypothetical protein